MTKDIAIKKKIIGSLLIIFAIPIGLIVYGITYVIGNELRIETNQIFISCATGLLTFVILALKGGDLIGY